MDRESIVLIENRMKSQGTIQVDLRGRDGIRRNYSLSVTPVNNFWVIIGRDMATSSFSKNELEVLLTITRLRSSSGSIEELMNSIRDELSTIMDLRQLSVVLSDASGIRRVYEYPESGI